jgi:hypothetical protein
VLTQLKRRGILCVDAPPERVSVETLNSYLYIHRRELAT